MSSVNREAERTLTYVSIRDNGADKVVRRIAKLSLGELRCLARLVQTVLLAFLLSGVAFEVACFFQGCAVGFLVADAECTGDAVADGARLTRHTAAVDVDDDVELVRCGNGFEGLIDDKTHCVEGEVILEGALVDGDVAFTGDKTHSCDGSLSSAGAEILNFLLYGFLRSHIRTSTISVPTRRGTAPDGCARCRRRRGVF